MSRPQFHSTDLFILRHAWLSLRDKHMLLAGSTRKLHSLLFVVVHSFYNGRRRRRDGRRWPPPARRGRRAVGLENIAILLFYHRLPLFLPVDMESTYGDITDSPFYEGEAQPSRADRCHRWGASSHG